MATVRVVGEKVRVQVGAESHRGEVVAVRETELGALPGRLVGSKRQVVTVSFWHQGRQERIEYFANDGALRWESQAPGCGIRYRGDRHLMHVCRAHTKPDAGGATYHICPCGERSLVAAATKEA